MLMNVLTNSFRVPNSICDFGEYNGSLKLVIIYTFYIMKSLLAKLHVYLSFLQATKTGLIGIMVVVMAIDLR